MIHLPFHLYSYCTINAFYSEKGASPELLIPHVSCLRFVSPPLMNSFEMPQLYKLSSIILLNNLPG